MFSWFAGFRMAQFAEAGLISDLSDQWPIDGMNDAFKQAATAPDGKQYFVPASYYPWAMFYRPSVFEKNGWTAPTTEDDFMALMEDMKGKGITPIAFGDKDGWPAMGTFDILNMRLNGFDFHMSLMAGEEKWDGDEVKLVFDRWAKLLPYHQEDPLGRTWQEAATAMVELVDAQGRVVQKTQSNEAGQFRFKSVDKGNYKVRVRKEGFKDTEAPVSAAPATQAAADLKLQ